MRRVSGIATWRIPRALIAYCALAMVPEWRYWNAGGTMMAATGGDPATGAWFLAWTPYALRHGLNPLVTDWGNYPAGVNAITGIGMPLLGVLGAPVTWLVGPYVTLTLLFTLAFALSALGGYALAREYVPHSRSAAFAAGLLYGFSPYLVAHGHYHLNLAFVPLPPLIFLVLGRVCTRGSLRSALALGLLCAAQFLISPEVLASTAIVGLIALAVAALAEREATRQRLRSIGKAAAVAAATAAACLAYPAWLLIAGPGHVTSAVQRTSLYRGDLLGVVVPNHAMFFKDDSSARLADTFSGQSENGMYLGIPLLVVLACGAVFVWRRRPAARIIAPVTVATFVLSLGSRLTVGNHVYKAVPLPEALLTHVPLLDNTIAARYALFTALGAATLLALILDAVHELIPGALPSGIPAAIAGIALVPLLPAWPYSPATYKVPAYFAAAHGAADGAAGIPEGSMTVTYPFPSQRDAYPMLWQISAGMRYKTPGGRFVAPQPPDDTVGGVFGQLAAGRQIPRSPQLRARLIGQLRAWDARTVLVQPDGGANPAQVVPFFTWLLGRAPDASQGGITAWYGLTSRYT